LNLLKGDLSTSLKVALNLLKGDLSTSLKVALNLLKGDKLKEMRDPGLNDYNSNSKI